ncbi:hypothetical protein RF11_00624 [Thelohanellus kitauei]|uniref:CCHC-type domain-containing protein n=1 Tax=Thelohanellus kitauei TaxID=669202 RepID=A0A0C2JNM7_THEKT|nr:hypothetical protein RF11_00624 [Thelohanellus kitauei]
MSVIENLAIMTKWSYSRFWAQNTVAMPDHLRLHEKRVESDGDLIQTAHSINTTLRKFRPTLPEEDVHTELPRSKLASVAQAIKREIENNGPNITATRSTSQEEKLDEVISLLRAVNFKGASKQTLKNRCYACGKEGHMARVCRSQRRQSYQGRQTLNTIEEPFTTQVQVNDGEEERHTKVVSIQAPI